MFFFSFVLLFNRQRSLTQTIKCPRLHHSLLCRRSVTVSDSSKAAGQSQNKLRRLRQNVLWLFDGRWFTLTYIVKKNITRPLVGFYNNQEAVKKKLLI